LKKLFLHNIVIAVDIYLLSSFSAAKSKAFIISLVICLTLLIFPTQALASVEGFVAKCDDGAYHQYAYSALLDSYALTLLGSSDGLYEDFKAKNMIALLDSSGGYIDYSFLLQAYASALLSGESFSLSSFSGNSGALKASIPGSVQLVSVQYGQLVRRHINPSQGGFEPVASAGDPGHLPAKPSKPEAPVTVAPVPSLPAVPPEKLAQTPVAVSPVVSTEKATQTPITGSSTVSLEKAIQWASSNGAHQRFIDVASLYWEYGQQSGIRPEVLFAQAAYETGFGRYGGLVPADYNNWAGIKAGLATGNQPVDFERFATPSDGVRAHFNHMSAYLGLNPIGEPHARYHSVKNISWAGTVALVEDLSGKWAPSSTYHERIVSMIAEMN
jgi:flagellum-specific peptidoglycan hydrolase FlgJ